MVDIDEKVGIQVFVRDLLDAGLLNGNTMTCTACLCPTRYRIKSAKA